MSFGSKTIRNLVVGFSWHQSGCVGDTPLVSGAFKDSAECVVILDRIGTRCHAGVCQLSRRPLLREPLRAANTDRCAAFPAFAERPRSPKAAMQQRLLRLYLLGSFALPLSFAKRVKNSENTARLSTETKSARE